MKRKTILAAVLTAVLIAPAAQAIVPTVAILGGTVSEARAATKPADWRPLAGYALGGVRVPPADWRYKARLALR